MKELLFTKRQIDLLGDEIRVQNIAINDETLDKLQSYRTSHNQALTNIFKCISECLDINDKTTILTYRIKRFQSIIKKLERFPDMRFSRMWDIAGCRCILNNINDVYELLNKIKLQDEIEIVKVNDYFKEPKDDGYKSLHLYIKHLEFNNIIEVQIRTFEAHNWATLVEITDLLFKTNLKEYGDDKTMLRFHKLLSDIPKLNLEEKYELAQLIEKTGYFEKLSKVFSRNYLLVRKMYSEKNIRPNHRYVLIEIKNERIPDINTFYSFHEAEDNYFKIYKNRPNANVVLTRMLDINYNNISKAYSNYILTYHSFLYESLDIIENLISDSFNNNNFYKFYKVYSLHNNLRFARIKNLILEVNELFKTQFEVIDSNSKSKDIKKLKNKRQEWRKDIEKQIEELNTRSTIPFSLINKSVSKGNKLSIWFNNKIISILSWHYKKKIKSFINENPIYFDN